MLTCHRNAITEMILLKHLLSDYELIKYVIIVFAG